MSPTRGESGDACAAAHDHSPTAAETQILLDLPAAYRWFRGRRVPALPPCGGDARQGRGG
ncbi:hypothetical protein GVN24_13145 [Rhizobium sp. CRIBSB]|nr:hypothetical protein [Rhizobium sp. CRIBSB]